MFEELAKFLLEKITPSAILAFAAIIIVLLLSKSATSGLIFKKKKKKRKKTVKSAESEVKGEDTGVKETSITSDIGFSELKIPKF